MKISIAPLFLSILFSSCDADKPAKTDAWKGNWERIESLDRAELEITKTSSDTMMFALVSTNGASVSNISGFALISKNRATWILDENNTPAECSIIFDIKGDSVITISQGENECGNNLYSLFAGDYYNSNLPSSKVKNNKEERLSLSFIGYNWIDTQEDIALAKDIDDTLLKCLHQPGGSSTMANRMCYYEAMTLATNKIQEDYQQLYNKLDAIDKALLETSQTRWKNYFTVEQEFLSDAFTMEKYGHGSGHTVNKSQWVFQIARQRLIALRVYNSQIAKPEED